MNYKKADKKIIDFFARTYIPVARVAFFIVFFWFGLIKLLGMSPASPLAESLISNTVGAQWFDFLFIVLAILECIIGILFLFPRAVRITIPLLFVHMLIVCSPLLLVPDLTWQSFLVPTLEGQYIIKNVVIVALAFGVAANTTPLSMSSRKR